MATKAKSAAKGKQVEEKVAVGGHVKFLGYDETVPEAERMLEADDVYPVIEHTEAGYIVQFTNPDFDETKAEDPDNNPSTLETEVFVNEVVPAEAPADAAPPAVAPATKVKAGKAPAAKAEKPAKAEKVKTPKAEKVKAEPKAEEDDLPDLTEEQEDPDVVAMVNESQDLVATAQELEGDIGRSEYHMGGVLFHLKKSKSYQELNEVYKERGGFQAFLKDYMNVDYRKAMYLIDIYTTFSLLGIENPADVVATLGWTKASKITGPMREEDANVDDLIKLASESTVADLTKSITEQQVEVGGSRTPGEIVRKVTMKFRYFEEEGASLMEIITAAKVQQGLDSDDAAVAFILNEWAALNSGGNATAKDAPAQTAPVGKAATKVAPKATPKTETKAPVAKASAAKAATKPKARAAA